MKYEKEYRKDHPNTIWELDEKFDMENYIKWIDSKYEALKQSENVVLDGVSVSDRTNELIGFILSSYKLLNNKTDFEQVYRSIVYKADDLKNKIEEHSR